MDVEYIVRFVIGFVIGWMMARYLIGPSLSWLAKKLVDRKPLFIDITNKVVAAGAPELPDNIRYMYDTKSDTVDINFLGVVYCTKVGVPDSTDEVPTAMVSAAKRTYRKFRPAFVAEEKRQAKLDFAKADDSGRMRVLGERREWVDDAS